MTDSGRSETRPRLVREATRSSSMPTAAGQNTRPMTEHRRSASRSSSSRRSRRAAITPCTESGIPPSAQPSRCDPATVPSFECSLFDQHLQHLFDEEGVAFCVRENRDAEVLGHLRLAEERRRRAALIRPTTSGASVSVVAFCLPAPQVGRLSSSSGRAVQTISRAWLSKRVSASSSIRSRSAADAQWTSSTTRIARLSRPSSPRYRRQASASARPTSAGSAVAMDGRPAGSPIVQAMASRTVSPVSSTTARTAARSFSSATSTGSVSRIRASVFAASASGQ